MNYIEIIKGKKPLFTKSELKICEAIISEEVDVINDSIVSVARKSNVSVSLVNKFCNKMGFSGWKEFKAIAVSSLYNEFVDENDEMNFMQNLRIQINSFIRKKKTINVIVESLIQDIKKAKRTILFAEGFTKILADLWSYKWQQIGINVTSLPLSLSSTKITKNDHIIFISCSGGKSDKIFHLLERGDLNLKQSSIITLGNININFKNKLNLGSFNKLPAFERSYPITSDVIMLLILNYIFQYSNKKDATFKNAYEE